MLGLFQNVSFAEDPQDSKSTSGGALWFFGSQTFVPVSWICTNKTAVSHSSAESAIVPLDADLKLEVKCYRKL